MIKILIRKLAAAYDCFQLDGHDHELFPAKPSLRIPGGMPWKDNFTFAKFIYPPIARGGCIPSQHYESQETFERFIQ